MKKKQSYSELRIIGGQLRSRKIFFEEVAGLRPTHNRVRETVFNWLQNKIENADCLDVFAGSGAMGFEAISRGAHSVSFCDISSHVIQNLKQNTVNLKIQNADFYQCDFMLENPVQNKQFDIVFLDPPFSKNLLLSVCELLEKRNLLKQNAFIYLEYEKKTVDITQLPKNWVVEKHKSTPMVEYVLMRS